MSDRLLKILLGVLVALVAAYGIARLATGGSDSPGESPFDLAMVAEADLDSVIIVSDDGTIRLRAGDTWMVDAHEAMAEAGESLKRALAGAVVGQLAARNPDNHERLGVAEGQGYRLTFYSGDEARLSFILGGEKGRAFDEAYVRRVGEDEVYTIKGALVNLARRGADDWRDKLIMSAQQDDIHKIEFEYPEESFSLGRDTAGWRLEPGGTEAESSVVRGLLGQLRSLRALGFAGDSVTDTLSWAEPVGRVRVLGPGDANLAELLMLKLDETGYLVRRSDNPGSVQSDRSRSRRPPVVYTLSAYSGDLILKKREELAPASAEE